MSPYSNFSPSSKRSEVICPEMTKTRFCYPTVFDAQLLSNPSSIFINLYRVKVDSVGYIFAPDSMRLSSFKFSWRAPKDARSTSRSAFWPFKVIRCRWFSCHLKGLVRLPISHQVTLALSLTVSEIRRLIGWKSPILPTPPLFNPKFENVPFALDRWNFACGERRHWAN